MSKPSRPARAGTAALAGTQSGLVVAGFGRHVMVETESGERVICHPRGKKSQVVVGDRIRWLPSQDEGTIEKIDERSNLFYRQDEMRTKSFAANLDQVLILIAAEPEFSESQLTRALIAAEAEHIKPVIALNKSDLAEPFGRAWNKLAPYRTMGYQILPLAIKPKAATVPEDSVQTRELMELLRGKKTLVLGPSGAGKSSLTNLLVPQAKVLTAEISQALNSGKHTTTSTTLYWVDEDRTTALIDSPGFQEFGLHHIEPMQLANYMPDFKAHAQDCKFYNCTHLHEPGCGVISEVKSIDHASSISANRYRLYSELFEELSQTRY
ncbi:MULTISPECIES: ribosome small subunit-dependent GTPase A [unclassified Polaromonas]|uniref:ribosome small subunit-dependent GTPase A n=1 Tax=unclassified Polaromonas TaxID=2638319 RepID=UPI0018CB3B9D|nr:MULTISPECIES: ribosome small subunit-dependent GTPase A [unclassified Polaromonas]MBG6071763.1 ribosome biogenesis GTPase [Polaromonas sp. CG_9.7]MBG6113764.1 ribosome biogenesis GTPase [Polaromonas sp. CG_9.2]MDH6184336.1 ribosome biogenesis GTPase [Polaromonas sp. CG_23.6]